MILCRQLENYDIQQWGIAWLESYLHSSVGLMGDIQPSLFIYVSDLPHGAQDSAVSMYADIMILYYYSTDANILNEDIDKGVAIG